MMTEGRVRAIAAQVAAAIAAKIKPSVSEEQIRSDVEAVIRQMQENGELTGSDLTDEQIAAVQENAEAAAESAQAAGQSAEEAETSKSQATEAQEAAEAAQRAAEAAESGAAQKATDAESAAQTAAGKATEASESATAAGAAKTAAEEAAARAEEAANRLLGVAVVGRVETVNGVPSIVLTGVQEVADYTAYYKVVDEEGYEKLVEIGQLVPKDETEPEPTTYTVTFVADGVTVETVTYEAGATSIEEPTVPAKDGYTGVWESYTLNDTNITVNAVYTAIEVEPTAPYDFAENFTVGRLKSNGTIDATTTDATTCTDYIGPIEVNDEIMIKGFGAMGDYNSAWYNGSKTVYEASMPNSYSGSSLSYAYDSASGVVTIKKVTDNQGYSYLRVGGKLTGTTADVVVNIKRDGEYLTE